MARAIDAEAADVNDISCYYGGKCELEDVQDWLDAQPTIEAEPVKHGEWVHVADNSTGKILQCTNCSYYYNPNKKDVKSRRITERPKRCMNCGAKMNGGAYE